MDLSQFSSASAVSAGSHTASDRLAIQNNDESNANASGVNPTLHVIGEVPLDDGKLDPNAQYVDLSIKEGQQIRFYVETTNDDHGNQA